MEEKIDFNALRKELEDGDENMSSLLSKTFDRSEVSKVTDVRDNEVFLFIRV